MSIFDKEINDFLKLHEEAHKCNFCGKPMKFMEEHGYYQCKKCKVRNEFVIKAPQILIAVGNKAIKLYWSICKCGKNNVTDESQEAYLQKEIFRTETRTRENPDGTEMQYTEEVLDSIEWEKNQNQQTVICTHCGKEFLNTGDRK